MSDFSMGTLVLKSLKKTLRVVLAELDVGEDTGFVHPVNDEWVGLFLSDEWMTDPATSDLIENVSKQVPLIHFMHPQDHGWYALVYVQGEIVCKIMRSYDAPEESVVECTDWTIWRTFGLDEGDIAQIRDIALGNGFDDVQRFKEVLGLTEFSFMSYGYLIDEFLD